MVEVVKKTEISSRLYFPPLALVKWWNNYPFTDYVAYRRYWQLRLSPVWRLLLVKVLENTGLMLRHVLESRKLELNVWRKKWIYPLLIPHYKCDKYLNYHRLWNKCLRLVLNRVMHVCCILLLKLWFPIHSWYACKMYMVESSNKVSKYIIVITSIYIFAFGFCNIFELCPRDQWEDDNLTIATGAVK